MHYAVRVQRYKFVVKKVTFTLHSATFEYKVKYRIEIIKTIMQQIDEKKRPLTI